MPMPPTIPQKWGIPGSEDVRLGRFGSQRLDHPVIHLRRDSILRELNSARTLSTTLLGFEFLQRPQHVLSNFLDRPHSSVLARSTDADSVCLPAGHQVAYSEARQQIVGRPATDRQAEPQAPQNGTRNPRASVRSQKKGHMSPVDSAV